MNPVPAVTSTSVSRWFMNLPFDGFRKGRQLQLLFIQILRAYLQTAAPMPASWLRALGDPRLAPALRLMHGDTARAWHLEELARACAMSRTTFAAHFRNVAGVAPLTYLAQWRMRLAERALREAAQPVASIARTLGYSSESAFSNAFKRHAGQSPKRYRDTMRAPAGTTSPGLTALQASVDA